MVHNVRLAANVLMEQLERSITPRLPIQSKKGSLPKASSIHVL